MYHARFTQKGQQICLFPPDVHHLSHSKVASVLILHETAENPAETVQSEQRRAGFIDSTTALPSPPQRIIHFAS